MTVSLPSRPVGIVDVPEATNFTATFVYNRFTNDERVTVPNETVPSEAPRYVVFRFSPCAKTIAPVLPIADNVGAIQREAEFSNNNYSGFELFDDNIDGKLFTIVSGSVAKQATETNRKTLRAIDDAQSRFFGTLNDEHSLLDAAKALAKRLPAGASQNVVVDALNQLSALRLSLIDESDQREKITRAFERLRDFVMNGQISNRIVGRVVSNVADDPLSMLADEFALVRDGALAKQAAHRSAANPSALSMTEFDPLLRAVKLEQLATSGLSSTAGIVGYMIEKFQLTDSGPVKHPPIITRNARSSAAYDTNVLYGATYVYTIRSIAQVRTRVRIDGTTTFGMGTGFVTSRPSSRIVLRCIENVPPPPPADFKINWSRSNHAPMLTWSFSVNKQMDVKGFQVFRRASIDEPFELLKWYDFDDSIVRTRNAETPDPALVERLSSPKLSFVDATHKKGKTAIYAVCSVDAHGLSSNYSMQLWTKFDMSRNRLDKGLVSLSGAPKSYPNMQLEVDTFVDTMRVSGAKTLDIVFDPEFLRVESSNHDDLGLFTFSNRDGGKYIMTLINTDLMEQQKITISIDDQRTEIP